jgi:hypothetical protein
MMRLIAYGKTVGELVAERQHISRTGRVVLEKLRMKTRAELIHYAIQSRLVDADGERLLPPIAACSAETDNAVGLFAIEES